MRWITGILLVLLGTASLTEAATWGVTTTNEQDAAIATLRDTFNHDRAQPLSEQEYRDYLLSQWIDGLVTQGKAQMLEQYKKAAEAAPTEIQNQVKALLTCGKVVCN